MKFPFCIKKTKKSHKTTDEPDKSKDDYDPDIPNINFIDEFSPKIIEIYKGRQTGLVEPFISETDGTIVDKVTGFLRRENDFRRKGWYIRPYEEDYEHMIKVNFMPLNKNDQSFQSIQTNVHKQGGTPSAMLKADKKQEFPKEQKLSTINEENSSALHEDKEELDKENENKSEDEDEELYVANLIARLFPEHEENEQFKDKMRRECRIVRKWEKEMKKNEMKKVEKIKMKTKLNNKIKRWTK